MSPVSCVSSYLEEHKNPPWGGLFLLTSSKLLQKHAHNCTRPPHPQHTKSHTLSGGPTSGAVSQSYLKRYLPGYSPHFTPNKT